MKILLLLYAGIILVFPGVAQVPVSQEPLHHNVLDNGHVRLLDVHIPPGDTTLFHIHATPSVFIVLTDANAGSELISEEDHSGSPLPRDGNISFEGFYVQPRIHRVYNRDTHEYHVMDIELTNRRHISIDPPISEKTFRLLFDEKPVRAYRVNPDPVSEISLRARRADILMIQLTDTDDSIQIMGKIFHQKGDFIYIPSGKPVRIENAGPGKAEFAFFELK